MMAYGRKKTSVRKKKPARSSTRGRSRGAGKSRARTRSTRSRSGGRNTGGGTVRLEIVYRGENTNPLTAPLESSKEPVAPKRAKL